MEMTYVSRGDDVSHLKNVRGVSDRFIRESPTEEGVIEQML